MAVYVIQYHLAASGRYLAAAQAADGTARERVDRLRPAQEARRRRVPKTCKRRDRLRPAQETRRRSAEDLQEIGQDPAQAADGTARERVDRLRPAQEARRRRVPKTCKRRDRLRPAQETRRNHAEDPQYSRSTYQRKDPAKRFSTDGNIYEIR